MIAARFKILAVIAITIGTILLPSLSAGDISVSLSLDRREASLDDTVRLSISIAGTQSSGIEPIIEGLDDFYVSEGGTSSRVQIINGSFDATVEHTYFLRPKKSGVFQIGPAEVVLGGNTYRSNTAPLQIARRKTKGRHGRGPLFLLAQVSSTKAHVEEQVIYTLKLCRRVRISDLALELPNEENLALKKLGKPLEYQSVFDGLTYQVLELRYVILASKEGMYALAPARMSMTVHEPRERSRRKRFDEPFFSDPFFALSRGKPRTIASQPLELAVIPLPPEGRPPSFGGLVGQFRITSQLTPVEITEGDSATLTVELAGVGNVSRLPDLVVPDMTNIKVYADQPVVESMTGESGLQGTKVMKWALVPDEEGQYDIPRLALSFFDPKAGQYKVVHTSPGILSVLPKAQSPSVYLPPGAQGHEDPLERKKEIEALGSDILPIHTSFADLKAGFTARPTGLVYWVFIIVPPSLLGFVFCGKRFLRKTKAERSILKAKRAAKILIKACKKDGLSNNDVAQAVKAYLNDRFDSYHGSPTPNEIQEMLIAKGVSLQTAKKLEELLQQLEYAIYTGKGDKPCQSEKDITTLITYIEKELR